MDRREFILKKLEETRAPQVNRAKLMMAHFILHVAYHRLRQGKTFGELRLKDVMMLHDRVEKALTEAGVHAYSPLRLAMPSKKTTKESKKKVARGD